MKTHLVFLEIAKTDLRAAKCLFCEKLYPQSVFHLQQSIEKAVKSFGIWNKIISETEARNAVGHKAWKVYSKTLSGFKKKVVELEKFLETSPRLKKVRFMKELKLAEMKNNLDNFQRMSLDEYGWDASFSKKELKNIIKEIDRLKAKLRRKIAVNVNVSEKEIDDLKRRFYEFLDTLHEINPSIAGKLEKSKNEVGKITPRLMTDSLKALIEFLSRFIVCSISLFYLSLVFSPHAIRTRYPEDSSPLQVYNDKMPLVQMLGSFIRITKETLENLDYVYASKVN